MLAFDTIVIGLGAVGSACLYQLSKCGQRVLGLDRYAPPHTYGSSHGETRITRQAIGEGEAYVPLVRACCTITFGNIGMTCFDAFRC